MPARYSVRGPVGTRARRRAKKSLESRGDLPRIALALGFRSLSRRPPRARMSKNKLHRVV